MRSGSECANSGKPASASLCNPAFSLFPIPMNHFTTPDFWEHYNALPREVRLLADKNYGLLQADPAHPSLHFKRVKDDVFSVKVGRHYRALAFEQEKGYDWFWIGPHTEYDHLLTHL